jgi:hypothetical protein
MLWLALTSFVLGAALVLDGPIDATLQLSPGGAGRDFARWLTEIGDW